MNNDLKKDKLLNENSLSLSKQLSVDNMYRNAAYLLFTVLVVVAFFISLASASFDFNKVFEAQFWIDFSITTGGGLLVKWAFGKYGNFEGHKNPAVKKATNDVELINKKIRDENLLEQLRYTIDLGNKQRKLKAYKKIVYAKAFMHPKSKKWQLQKECVMLMEEYLNPDITEDRQLEIENKLFEYNFDLDAVKGIKYPAIAEASLKTGNVANEEDDESFSYSEMYELFGKNAVVTILSIFFSLLLASASIVMGQITWVAAFLFVSRVATYVMNAYVGFTTGKSSVETKKLTVLNSIHTFLSRFIEISLRNKEVKNINEQDTNN